MIRSLLSMDRFFVWLGGLVQDICIVTILKKKQQGRLERKGKTWKNVFLENVHEQKCRSITLVLLVPSLKPWWVGVFFSPTWRIASFRIFAGWIFIYFPGTLFWCLKMCGRVQVISKSQYFFRNKFPEKNVAGLIIVGVLHHLSHLC